MIAPSPHDREARALAEELESKRERYRLRDGKLERIGVPLTNEERAWLLVYSTARKRMSETGKAKPRRSWWRR